MWKSLTKETNMKSESKSNPPKKQTDLSKFLSGNPFIIDESETPYCFTNKSQSVRFYSSSAPVCSVIHFSTKGFTWSAFIFGKKIQNTMKFSNISFLSNMPIKDSI